MVSADLSAVRYVDLGASLVTFCSWCRHSEFVHSDRETGLCLFSECECPRFFPMLEGADPDLEDVASGPVGRRNP